MAPKAKILALRRNSRGQFISKAAAQTSEDEIDETISLPGGLDTDYSFPSSLDPSANASTTASPLKEQIALHTAEVPDEDSHRDSYFRRYRFPQPSSSPLHAGEGEAQAPAMTKTTSALEKPTFAGDLNRENPKQFWNNVEEYLEGLDEATKCKRIRRLWEADSAADAWYEELGESVKQSWAALEEEFRKEWVKKDMQDLADHDMLAMLKTGLPSDHELLLFDTRNGRPVSGLVRWARDVSNLVRKHKIPDRLAERFRSELKAVVLRDALPTVTSWKEFNTAIEGLELAKLKDRIAVLEAYSPKPATTEQPKLSLEHGKTPVTIEDLNNLVARLSVANPVSQPPTSVYHAYPAQGTAYNGQRLRSAPAMPSSRLRPDERLAFIRAKALQPPPDTEEGRQLYERQKEEWHAKHGSKGSYPNEHRPYPLRPGTLPVASDECWRCGTRSHTRAVTCPGPRVDDLENQWRVAAGMVEGEVRRMNRAVGVQLVESGHGEGAYSPPEGYEAARVGQVFLNGQWVPFVAGGTGAELAWDAGNA